MPETEGKVRGRSTRFHGTIVRTEENPMKTLERSQRTISPAAVLLLALATVSMGLAALPAVAHTGAVAVRGSALAPISVHPSVRPLFAPAPAAHPAASGFPRTVLVEPFTELWCQFCPGESQALYGTEHKYSTNYVVISELHPCATGTYSNCQDKWPTLDGIADWRWSDFYHGTGYPTVWVDGTHPVIGDVNYDTAAQLEVLYNGEIANASAIPGNVSISQSAAITTGSSATVQETITSDITGSYLALTYLTEAIDQNVSGTNGLHDIGSVVRAAVINETVVLTAGETTTVSGTVALSPTWNMSRLSAVSLVQDRTSMVIENSNEVPVSTLSTAITASAQTISAGQGSKLHVTVTNGSTSAPIAGATVTMTSDTGGTFSPASGVTAANGTFTTEFTAPQVTAQTVATVGADVVAAGYVGGTTPIEITVNPNYAPAAPTAVAVTSALGDVALQWTAPATGSGGLSYNILRSTSASGTFAQVGSSSTTSFTDTTVQSTNSYWYELSAQDSGGVSALTAAVVAVPVLANPSGLPASVAWWLQFDTTVYNSSGSAPISLYVAAGPHTWAVGVDSYEYLPPQVSTGSPQLTDQPLLIAAAFAPNDGVVAGTVNPVGASVLLNGTAVTVTGGAFSVSLFPGSYPLVVSAPGYKSLSENVVVTAGNTTPLPISLQANPSSTSGSGLGSMGGTTTVVLVGAGAVGAAAVASLLVWSRKRRGPG